MFHFICKLQVSGSKSRNSTRGKMNDDSWTKKTVSLRSLTLDHVLFKHRCVSLPTFQVGKVAFPSLYVSPNEGEHVFTKEKIVT